MLCCCFLLSNVRVSVSVVRIKVMKMRWKMMWLWKVVRFRCGMLEMFSLMCLSFIYWFSESFVLGCF